MTKGGINKAFFSMLDPVLNPLGFSKVKGSDSWQYVKQTPDGYNEVTIVIWEMAEVFYVALAFSIRLSELNNVFNPFSTVVPTAYETNATIGTGFWVEGCDDSKRVKIESDDDLDKAVSIMEKVLKEKGLPFFETLTSVDAFDQEFNKDNRERDLYASEMRSRPFIGITAAALNKNPHFPKWEDYYRTLLQRAPEIIQKNYEELTKVLKEKYLKKE